VTQFIENRERSDGFNLRWKDAAAFHYRAGPRWSDDDPVVGGHMLLVTTTTCAIVPITMRRLDLAECRQVPFQRDRQRGETWGNALEMQLRTRLTCRRYVSADAWTHKKSS